MHGDYTVSMLAACECTAISQVAALSPAAIKAAKLLVDLVLFMHFLCKIIDQTAYALSVTADYW